MFLIAIVNQFFHWFIIGIIVPVLALFQLEKGLNLLQIGVNSAVYSISVVALELPTGGLADAIGRKRVYLLSLCLNFIAGLILLFFNRFFLLVFGVLFMGIGRALSSGSMDAYFVDELYKIDPKGNLQEMFARIGIFIPLGLSLGALLGGYLPMTLGEYTSAIKGFGRYSSNLIVMGLLFVIQFIVTSLLIKEEVTEERSSSFFQGFRMVPGAVKASVEYGLRNRCIFMVLVATFAWGLSFSSLENYWQPQVKNILGSDKETWLFGVLATGYFLSGSLGSLLITPLCRMLKNRHSMILFFLRLLMGMLYFLLALQGSFLGFSVFYLTLFLFNGMSNSPNAAILNSRIPSDKRSTLLSLDSFFMQLGGVFGALMAGTIAEKVSIPVAWYVAASFIGLSCLSYLFIHVWEKSG